MTIKKCISLLFLMLLLPLVELFASDSEYAEGEVLIRMRSDAEIQKVVSRSNNRRATNLRCTRRVSEPFRVYQLSFDNRRMNELEMLEMLRQDPDVEVAQLNHKLTYRSTTPNDEKFGRQWQYINTGQDADGVTGADMDADLAWDITTGGTTYFGDTIVVCVIDGNFEYDHPDLIDNLWVNKDEIPDNNIDDDNNGYVDDYYGWNVFYEDDGIGTNSETHGTQVAGIVGARGNNGIGVSGVSWNVKVMLISGGGWEDDAISSYSYALEARKRYNETNGAEGAFVVATNASWGVENTHAEEAPLWCEMYDKLGAVGILSAGATTNHNTNVEVDGDLPTTCTSDYLISVTNVGSDDKKVIEAGYGNVSIDLGSFGEFTYTIITDGMYDTFGGTSAATPHVAGSIGLLYSAPCESFMQLVKSNPAEATLLIKKCLMEGGDPNVSLRGKTVSGNRLNLNGSLEMLMSECYSCIAPVRVDVENITDVEATIVWDTINSNAALDTLRYRKEGDTEWMYMLNPTMPQVVDGLSACTSYEFQINCSCTDTSFYTSSYKFKTDGCLENPSQITVLQVYSDSLLVGWNSVMVADSYDLRICEAGTNEWQSYSTSESQYCISGLTPCTDYVFQIRTICDTPLPYADSTLLKTSGCGACLDKEYCQPVAFTSANTYIKRVKLNTIDYASGASSSGYDNQAGNLSTDLKTNSSYMITLEPGFDNGWDFEQYLRIWIDLNGDGILDEETEEVLKYNDFVERDSFQINIPADAVLGLTRMRVSMCSYKVTPCSAEDEYGETEDFCVNLVQGPPSSIEGIGVGELTLMPNPFDDQFEILVDNSQGEMIEKITMVDCSGKVVYETVQPKTLNGRLLVAPKGIAQGIYFVTLTFATGESYYQKIIKE